MSTLLIFVPRVAAAERTPRRLAPHRIWQSLAAVLDRLVPPPRPDRETELPPEWFKYPLP